MNLGDFDYFLPVDLIAQKPVRPRDHSKLMVIDRKTGKITHDHFFNLHKYLNPDDILVFNNSKVFPARLFGRKSTGGAIEILLIRYDGGGWKYVSRPGIKKATGVNFGKGVSAVVDRERATFNITYDSVMGKLKRIGYTPIPPYIHPPKNLDEPKLRRMYQTVYAAEIGSAAAPTAGFHFTRSLLKKISHKEFLTLHVGLGTFAPVRSDDVTSHVMHSEFYTIGKEVAARLVLAKSQGKRIMAVGTTAVRTLETWAETKNTSADTDIFIYPGYKFKFVDAMITNFHLPKSTLLMLVCAFARRDLVTKAYQEAIRKKYRFYSFGDAMLIV